MRVGNPATEVRVLISTAGCNTWVIQSEGCPSGAPGINPTMTCAQSRGELFSPSLSTTWSPLGNYSQGVEANLGYNTVVGYGLDTVALGFNNDTGGPTLQGQVVAGVESYLFYTGLFGLNNQPSNFTASNDEFNLTDTKPYPSFLTTMRNQSLIPSLSWAYTAGAIYSKYNIYFYPSASKAHSKLCCSLCESFICITNHQSYTRVVCLISGKGPSNKSLRFAFVAIPSSLLTRSRIERSLWKFDIWRLRSLTTSPK